MIVFFTCNLVQVYKIIVVYLLSKLFLKRKKTYVTYEIDFYVFIGTIFYVTCVEFFEIPYIERFYLPFEDKKDRTFLFKRARRAERVKFSLNFGLSRGFLYISDLNVTKKFGRKTWRQNFKYNTNYKVCSNAPDRKRGISVYFGAQDEHRSS